jgi:4-carboxymuconolactone decarboxylase
MANLFQLSERSRADSHETRFALLRLSELHGSQLALGEEILANTRSGLSGIWNVFLNSPGVTSAFLELYDYLRSGTPIALRLIEMTALLVAVEEKSDYVWAAHAPLALRAGLSESLIEALKNGLRPAQMQPDEEVLYEFLALLLREGRVTRDSFAAASAVFSAQSLVDFVALVGQYKTVSMLIKVADLPPPAN